MCRAGLRIDPVNPAMSGRQLSRRLPRDGEVRPQLFVDVDAGYSFDRFYFEGEDYGDRGRNRIDVGDGPFVQVRVGARF